MQISITHNLDVARQVIDQAPQQFGAAIDGAVARGAAELANDIKRRAPKFTSQMTNAVLPSRVAPMHHQVTVGKQYASHVENGSNPGGRPAVATIERWIRLKGITPRTPGLSRRSLAHLIRQSIAAKGIRPQPFAAPAVARFEGRLGELIGAALDRVATGLGAR